MIDLHQHPDEWGILPDISIFGLEVATYPLFVLLGLLSGLAVYYFLAREKRQLGERNLYIVLAGIFGGIVGAKIPIWLMHFDLIASDPALLLPGRTIVGGIIGGTISVYAAKKILRIRGKKGNMFAPAIALGVAIGRIGCFLTGCCYGKHTTLPWGVDFGDGPRHPTQLYEAGFMLIVFFYLLSIRKNAKPGFLYMMFVNLYFSFRFIEEFIKEGDLFLGLNIFQYLSLAAIFVMNIKYIIDRRKPYANEE